MSFSSFLNGCKTFDPGYSEPRDFPEWEYVKRLAHKMETEERLLVVKSRQMMVTWLGCAYILFRAVNSGPGIHLVLSKEERSARELIERIRFLLGHLNKNITVPTFKAKSNQISFSETSSRIISLPATPHAVRGLSPHTVFWDEMAFTQYDDEIWTAVKPAIDSGGSFLGVSTPNGPKGVFADLIHGDNPGFDVFRLHYSENPEKSNSWEKDARSGLSESRWRREQELSFEGAEGKVYDQFQKKRHVLDSNYSPGREIGNRLYRGIDFGYRRPAVVWVEEKRDGSLIVFDNLIGNRWPLETLLLKIQMIDMKHGLSEKDFTWTAVDPAGSAKGDFGLSPVEYLQQKGLKLIWRTSNISPGIEAVRSMLMNANGKAFLKLVPCCNELIDCFESYAWAKDGELPEKDGESDHLMDALRYLVVNLPRFQLSSPVLPPRIVGLPQDNLNHGNEV